MVSFEELSIGTEIRCAISLSHCCYNFPTISRNAESGISPSGNGSWRYPNGTYVLLRIAGDSFGIVRNEGVVSLEHQGSHDTEGLWTCETYLGSNKAIYIGIYPPGKGEHQLLY